MPKNQNLPAVLTSKTPKVYKNKKLNNANFADFTQNDYQIFLFLISKLGKVDEQGKYLQPAQLQREHTLTALEFSTFFNTDLDNSYKIIRRACLKLMKTDIKINDTDLRREVRVNVCSKSEYLPNEGKIFIKFTDDIMPYLAQVKQKFVLYNLKEIARFSSLYTTRLYELVQEFKDTGYIRKSVDDLRELFAVGNTLPFYANFKVKTLTRACNEINEKTAYNISFTEIKTGRKVTAIEFHFKQTIVEKRYSGDGTQKNTYIKPEHKNQNKEH